MNALFVTGTDTGVGKSAVTAALLAWMRSKGIDAVPMKPVQTGWPESDDAAWALQVAGIKLPDDELSLVNPYRFPLAASPHLACREASGSVELSVLDAAFDKLRGRHQTVVVEGAGGLLVPIAPELQMIDLVKRYRLPVLVVARPGLGTLNHTQLTLRELERHAIPVIGVVLSETVPGKWRLIEEDNLQTLAHLAGVPVRRLPHLSLSSAGALAGHVQTLDKVFSAFPMLG